jgi:hypothetical protein
LPDEEIDIYLRWKQENQEVASDAANRVDRISDALMRMRIAAEAAQARLSALSSLGLFNRDQARPSRDPNTINLTEGPGQFPLLSMAGRIESLLDMYKQLRLEAGQGAGQGVMQEGSGYNPLQLLARNNVEIERQGTLWYRIRDAVGDVWNRITGVGEAIWNRLAPGLQRVSEWIVTGFGKLLDAGDRLPVIGGSMERASAGLESLGAAGATALPVLLGIVVALLTVLGAVVSLIAFLYVLGAVVVAATAIMATFLAGAAAVAILVGGLLAIFGALAAGIVFWGATVQGGAGAQTALTTATTKLQTAQEGLDASQLALSKWWANHPFGAKNQSDVLALAGLMDRLRDSQDKVRAAHEAYATAVANSQTPLQKLMGFLDEGIAAKLEPLAVKISNFALTWALAWAQTIGPAVVDAGTRIMNWIGDRLPGALNAIKKVVDDLAPSFQIFAEFIGKLFDRNIGPGLGPAIEGGVRAALAAVTGLLTNLERLSNWFNEKLPDGQTRWQAYGAIVGQILSFAGSAVQAFAGTWARFADWLVTNWPSIVQNAKDAIDNLSAAWKALQPVLDFFITQVWPILKEAFIDLAKHSGTWLALLVLLAGIFLTLITFGVQIVDWAVRFANWLVTLVGRIGDFLGKLNEIAAAVNPFRFIQEWAQQLWQKLQDVLGLIQKVTGTPDTSGNSFGGGKFQLPPQKQVQTSSISTTASKGGTTNKLYNITNNFGDTSDPAGVAAAIARSIRATVAL